MQLAKDKRIPYYFVAFFLGLFIVDGIMVTLAVRSHTGTVMEHPYEEGLRYNRTIEAANAQKALGWQSVIELEQSSSGQGKVTFDIKDASGNPIHADTVTALFTRPTQSGHDFELPLKRIGSRYSVITDFPLTGLWEVRIYVKKDTVDYQQSKRIIIE